MNAEKMKKTNLRCWIGEKNKSRRDSKFCKKNVKMKSNFDPAYNCFRTKYPLIDAMNDGIETAISRTDMVLSKIDNFNQYFENKHLISGFNYGKVSDKVIDFLNGNMSKLFQDINKQLVEFKTLELGIGDNVSKTILLQNEEKENKINTFLQVAIDELADAVENANFNRIMSDNKIIPSQKFSLKLYNFHLPKCKNEDKIRCPPVILLLDHAISVIWMLFSVIKKKRKRLFSMHCIWAIYFLNYYIENKRKHPCISYCIQKIQEQLDRLEKPNIINHNKLLEQFSKKFIHPNVKQLQCIKKNSIIYEKLMYLQRYEKLELMGRYILQTLLINLSYGTVSNINLTLEETSQVKTILNNSEESENDKENHVNTKVNNIFDKLLKSFLLLKDMNKNLSKQFENPKSLKRKACNLNDTINDLNKISRMNKRSSHLLIQLQNNINEMENDDSINIRIRSKSMKRLVKY